MEIFGFSVAVLFYTGILLVPILLVFATLLRHVTEKITGNRETGSMLGNYLVEFGYEEILLFRRLWLSEGLFWITFTSALLFWSGLFIATIKEVDTLLEVFVQISMHSTPFFVVVGAAVGGYLATIFVGKKSYNFYQKINTALSSLEETKDGS